jgi:ribosomal protein L16 Arg81 hydroxylase
MQTIDNNWRQWIAENLLLEASPQSIHAALTGSGVDAAAATREIEAALASPYLLGGQRMRNRMKKRDWILDVYGTLDRLRAGAGAVERRERLSRDEFFNEYYCRNRPVVITGMLDDWPALRRWNFDYFRSRFGERQVEVQFGRETDPNFEINQPKHKRMMRFGDYVDLVERSAPTNDFYMTANNTSLNREALAELWEDIGKLPEYLDGNSPDRGFFWFGPKGTKTPLHHDLTNNFMAQVIGRKRIRLIPLHETPRVYNDVHCYTQVDAAEVDVEKFPAMRDAQVIDCEIGPGEILFLPIGWWHHVDGLETAVTMTFINFALFNNFAERYSSYGAL